MINTSGQSGSQFWLANDGTSAMYIRSTDGANNWGNWREIAEVDNVIPIAGNTFNTPMTGDLFMGNRSLHDVRVIEMGLPNLDQTAFIDFHSSSDPSQSDYSTKIVRNSGVAGDFDIIQKGTGTIRLSTDGGNIFLNTTGSIDHNNARCTRVGNPVSSTDGANKAYVDSIGGYGALLGSVSLASGSGSKFIAWNNAWDSYDFIQLVVKDFTGSQLGDRVAIGLWNGSSWEGISNTSGQSGQEIFFSPVQTGITSPTFKSSFMYEIGLGSSNLVPVLQRSSPGNIPLGQEFSRQGWLKQASHTNGVVSSEYSSWGNASGLSGKSWGLDLDTGNYTGGTFNLYGFNYPT
jgi:hypothetical protein